MKDWQVYTANGSQIEGKGTNWDVAFTEGVPHAAAHVWIWRCTNNEVELLFQKCAPKVSYKVGLLDISAAGHVDVGEPELVSATRELKEEIGLDVDANQLYLAGVEHFIRKAENYHKDEFRYIYTLRWNDTMKLHFSDGEVDGVEWIKATNSKSITDRPDFTDRFVQHSNHYFTIVFSAIHEQL